MRYKKKQKKYFITLLVIIILLLSIYIFNSKKTYFKIEELFKDISLSIENIFIPKVSVNYNEIILGINNELESENSELKKILNLDENKYNFIHADVIKRDFTWYQELTINKGRNSGITDDLAVIADDHLIGRISRVGNTSSTVKLLTSSDMKVAVDIINEIDSYHGIINNYNNSMLEINNIAKNSEIKVGDKVYTNGLGGIYPSGIYIGTVKEIDYDELGLSKIVKVNYTYNNFRYVSVIGRDK